jgi:diguanylate cyclase (GGDEF)-like protein
MENNIEDNNIDKLIDTKLWKKVQDILAETIKLPVCSVDIKGNEILLSGELPFYCQILNSTERGKELCRKCKKYPIKELYNKKDKVLLYYCEAGLLNIWTSIFIENKYIGNIGCVSLLDNTKDISKLKKIAYEAKLEEDELVDALNEIRVIKLEEARMYGKMLYIITKIIPELARQKRKSDEKIFELTTIHDITQMINSTLDIEKIFKYIINFMIEYSKARNCSMIIFNNSTIDKSYCFRKTNDMDKIENVISKDVVNAKSIVRLSDIKNDFRFKHKEIEGVFNSVIAVPLKVRGNVIGAINLYYNNTDPFVRLGNEDLEFISIIADQVALAIINAKQFEQIKETAITDKLTDLYNRRYFMDILKREIVRCNESKSFLTTAMIDIDDFKHYNDTNGHIKGDTLLKNISNILKKEVRSTDIVGRYGGEEFIIIFPDTRNDKALEIIENIRKNIESYDFEGKELQPMGKVTISAGLITSLDRSLTDKDLIELADKALYEAKTSGKNRVISKVIISKNLKIDTK